MTRPATTDAVVVLLVCVGVFQLYLAVRWTALAERWTCIAERWSVVDTNDNNIAALHALPEPEHVSLPEPEHAASPEPEHAALPEPEHAALPEPPRNTPLRKGRFTVIYDHHDLPPPSP